MLLSEKPNERRLRPSREHIIPSALGGSDAFCTFDVCERCNSRLGETTDGNFMKEQITAIIRQKHGISSYSNKIPDLVMKAVSIQTGTVFDMRISPAGEVTYTAPPVVKSTSSLNGTEGFEVYGSREQVAAIVEGKKAKIERSGRKITDAAGNTIISVAESVAAAPSNTTTELNAHFKLNQTVVRRGLIKVAFGFAHLILGANWTFSSEAEPLRAVVLGKGCDEDVAALVCGVKLTVRNKLLSSEVNASTRHIVALFPAADETIILVSLFGEELLTIGVRIQVTPAQMEVGIGASNRMAVSTLAKGGDVKWLSIEEFGKRWFI